MPEKVAAMDLERMTLTEIIQLQNELSKTLQRRFGRDVALVFTDVVDSTPYFQRFGDEAGRRLLQRHLDLLREVVAAHGGRIVDTAGDGAFSACPWRSGGAGARRAPGTDRAGQRRILARAPDRGPGGASAPVHQSSEETIQS
jgi:class 3 adenylate cyclase